MNFFKKVWDFIASPSNSRTAGILVVLIILAAIPLTVIISQNQQEIRQRAGGGSDCTATFNWSQYSSGFSTLAPGQPRVFILFPQGNLALTKGPKIEIPAPTTTYSFTVTQQGQYTAKLCDNSILQCVGPNASGDAASLTLTADAVCPIPTSPPAATSIPTPSPTASALTPTTTPTSAPTPTASTALPTPTLSPSCTGNALTKRLPNNIIYSLPAKTGINADTIKAVWVLQNVSEGWKIWAINTPCSVNDITDQTALLDNDVVWVNSGNCWSSYAWSSKATTLAPIISCQTFPPSATPPTPTLGWCSQQAKDCDGSILDEAACENQYPCGIDCQRSANGLTMQRYRKACPTPTILTPVPQPTATPVPPGQPQPTLPPVPPGGGGGGEASNVFSCSNHTNPQDPQYGNYGCFSWSGTAVNCPDNTWTQFLPPLGTPLGTGGLTSCAANEGCCKQIAPTPTLPSGGVQLAVSLNVQGIGNPPAPTPTSTPTPVPSVTITPAPTITTAVTPAASAMLVNPNPLHKNNRAIKVIAKDASNNVVSTGTGTADYSSSNGTFSGNVAMGNTLTPGTSYKLIVKMGDFLIGFVPTFTFSGTTASIDTTNLIVGVDENNNLSTAYYGAAFVPCYNSTIGKPTCEDPLKADLNDDGSVNGLDYNIFLKSLQMVASR